MCRKLEVARMGEARVITNAKIEIAELEKNHEVAIKDLKVKANSQMQWLWKGLNLARSRNE